MVAESALLLITFVFSFIYDAQQEFESRGIQAEKRFIT